MINPLNIILIEEEDTLKFRLKHIENIKFISPLQDKEIDYEHFLEENPYYN